VAIHFTLLEAVWAAGSSAGGLLRRSAPRKDVKREKNSSAMTKKEKAPRKDAGKRKNLLATMYEKKCFL